MIHSDLINNVFSSKKRRLPLSPLSAIKIWAVQYSLIWQIFNECLFHLCQTPHAGHWRYKSELNTIPPYSELTAQKGSQTCKQTIPVEIDGGCLKKNKNRRWRMDVFSYSWFKCKIIIHFQFEGAKRYKQMENKQSHSTFLKYIAVSSQQPHRHYMPSTLLGAGEMTQNSRPRSSHILEVLQILTGKVRHCRLQLNYAVPCPSMAMERGGHWRFFFFTEDFFEESKYMMKTVCISFIHYI